MQGALQHALLVVGGVLLLGGLAKVVDLPFAGSQFQRYFPLAEVPAQWSVAALSVVEALLGASLLFGVYRTPGAALACGLLGGLAVTAPLVAWRKNLDECGCYGKLVRLKPWQSATVNLLCSAVLAAWLWRGGVAQGMQASLLGMVLLGVVLALTGGLAWHSARHGMPLVFSPFKPLRPWPIAQLRAAGVPDLVPSPATDAVIVVFATQDCAICQSWLKFLNEFSKLPDELPVVAVIGAGPRSVETFRRQFGLDIALVEVPLATLLALWSRPPLAVHVERGRVVDCWRGRLPRALVDRVKAHHAHQRGPAGQYPQVLNK